MSCAPIKLLLASSGTTQDFFIFFIDLKKGIFIRHMRTTYNSDFFCSKEIQFTTVLSALPPASLLFSRSVPGMSSDRFPVL